MFLPWDAHDNSGLIGSIVDDAPILRRRAEQPLFQMQLLQNRQSFEPYKIHQRKPEFMGLRYSHGEASIRPDPSQFLQNEIKSRRVLTHSDHPTSVCDGSRVGDSSNGIRNTWFILWVWFYFVIFNVYRVIQYLIKWRNHHLICEI